MRVAYLFVANLREALLRGAIYDDRQWPDGFTPLPEAVKAE